MKKSEDKKVELHGALFNLNEDGRIESFETFIKHDKAIHIAFDNGRLYINGTEFVVKVEKNHKKI